MKKLTEEYDLPEKAGVPFEPIVRSSGFDHPAWPILTAAEPDTFTLGQWGLVPGWVRNDAQAIKIRTSTLNARAETLSEKPSFKNASIRKQRCVVPSTGFFEWQTIGKKKYPYFIRLKDSELLSMAGLYEEWVSEHSGRIMTFTIVTVPANPLMEKIHNTKKRMPALLVSEGVKHWLDVSTTDQELARLLTPLNESYMEAVSIQPLPQISENLDFDAITQPYEYPELTRQLGLF
ncbi:MAG: SOS response-associated peptidase [Bacteroidetes bacterium]|nr:SOS response-associated peptidase [Bacteroidota bacterium]